MTTNFEGKVLVGASNKYMLCPFPFNEICECEKINHSAYRFRSTIVCSFAARFAL